MSVDGLGTITANAFALSCGVPSSATFYRDGDGDGFGDAADPVEACVQPAGYVGNSDDCDDSDPAIGVCVTVDARDNADSPVVVVTVPANTMVTISDLTGSACVNSGVGCSGPSGISQAECNSASTGECNCTNRCGGEPYLALRRDGCLSVSNGSFNSLDGQLEFFVTADCTDSNNTGGYSFTMSY